MPEPRKTTQRPRIDAILRAIREGKYDDKLSDIQKAVSDRNEQRKAAVLKLVKEIYGPDSDVTTMTRVLSSDNPFRGPNHPTLQDAYQRARTEATDSEDSPQDNGVGFGSASLEAQMEAELENRGAVIGEPPPGLGR